MSSPLPSYLKYSRMAESICCPQCKGGVDFKDALWCGAVVINAEISCQDCGICGKVCNTKFIFNDNPACNFARPGTLRGALLSTRREDYFKDFAATGAWQPAGDRYWCDEPSAQLQLKTKAIGVDLRFLKHSWGGVAEVLVNGAVACTLDLFEKAGSMELSVPIALGKGDHSVAIRVTNRKSDASHSTQVFFCGYDELTIAEGNTCDFTQFSANLGNSYPARWADLIDECAADGLILDCGAGDRRYPDPRVVNFEYTPFALPDVFGDGHHLPFKDETFALILSQAVIEHLYDPFAATGEIYRVSEHGGVTLAESAFMQPLHAVPFHFFNTTKWGLEKLFEKFDVIATDAVGTLAQTLEWIYSLVDLPEDQRKNAAAIVKAVAEVDAYIPAKDLEKFASFIRLEARRS